MSSDLQRDLIAYRMEQARKALEHAKAFVERTAEFLKDADKKSG